MKQILFFLLLIFIGQQQLQAQKTVKIWIVRHAEKDASDPKDKDPDLTDIGAARANALMKELKGQKIDSIFATDYKRTKLTAFPLADHMGIAIKTYSPTTQKAFAKELSQYAKGKKVLIVGHSNTVLELIEAFGGKKPVKELTDDDYDYIFELTVKENATDVKVSRYGASHHTNE